MLRHRRAERARVSAAGGLAENKLPLLTEIMPSRAPQVGTKICGDLAISNTAESVLVPRQRATVVDAAGGTVGANLAEMSTMTTRSISDGSE